MRILVGITSYGLNNEAYLTRIINTYENMSKKVDITVFSNIPRKLGRRVEVIVGLPNKDPWSLGYAHRKTFMERANEYDLFIYSEDDIEILESNIEFFLKANAVVGANEIPGLFRYEIDASNRIRYPDVHDRFHWDPTSVKRNGDLTFAYFTNDHSACYLLTRDQLKSVIDSGGYGTGPLSDEYDLLVSAATDPYKTCGYKKMLCISHIKDIQVHHLSDKYSRTDSVHITALEEVYFKVQLQEMLSPEYRGESKGEIGQTAKKSKIHIFDKPYYEGTRWDVVRLVGKRKRTILSVGYGCGRTEEELARQGHEVVAVPIDRIIAKCARARGIATAALQHKEAIHQLSERRFDCLMFLDLLQHVENPVELLCAYLKLLSAGGFVMISVPNLDSINSRRAWTKIARVEKKQEDFFRVFGIQFTTEQVALGWIESCGLETNHVEHLYGERAARIVKLSLGIGRNRLSKRIVIRASKMGEAHFGVGLNVV